jgi:hypothetical protein
MEPRVILEGKRGPQLQHVDAKGERFAVAIKCPACSQVGSVTWEKARTPTGDAAASSKLISVSNGFHTDHDPARPGGPRIVCDHCDTVQPD